MAKQIIISGAFSYSTQEETLEIERKQRRLVIGIPREEFFQENRIGLSPEAVSVLVNEGHDIIVEHKAGEKSYYFDTEYSEAGARIVYDKQDVYKCPIIVKSAPVSENELPFLQQNQLIFSPIHLPLLKEDTIKHLLAKRIVGVSFESIKDEDGSFPIVRSMSEIAGSSAILTAAQYMSNGLYGKGVLLGGITGVPPVTVVIIGAGIVGEFAARTALGLGAMVQIFDSSIYRLMRIQNHLGHRCFTSVIDPNTIATSLKYADVVVGALKPVNGITPVVVTEEMVSQMKAGAVIVDVSIDSGGCFETSKPTSLENPVYKCFDVIHYCVPNIPSNYARTASRSISNVMMSIIQKLGEAGGMDNLILESMGIRHGIYVYKGAVTSPAVSKKFGLKYTDLDLLLSYPG